jgi:8-amino-7-oxononanoate synthase
MLDPDRELAGLDAQGLLRHRHVLEGAQGVHVRLDGQEYLSFASNDYLGLASHPDLIRAVQEAAGQHGVGAGASHLLTGHHALHHELETRLADFVRLPAALLFSTGYMANLGVISALAGREAEIFSDRLNHASLVDAALMARAAVKRYPHLDLEALDGMLARSTARQKLVVTDAVFSMDGDIAPVPQLLALCEKHDARLLVDDAHGFGVLGESGGGVLEHFAPTLPSSAGRHSVYMATLGKAAGVFGAFVAGDRTLMDWLIQKARTYVYTTATPPMLAAALLASLRLLAEPGRRVHLRALISGLKNRLSDLPWALMPSDTPIQPLMVGGNEAALSLSDALLERGILIPAIRPPTVPKGQARLRISLSAAHEMSDLDRLGEALHDIARH